MPKGTMHLVVALVVLVAAIGLWTWWDRSQERDRQARRESGTVSRLDDRPASLAERPAAGMPARRPPLRSNLPDQRFEPDEVVVVNPPARFDSLVRDMGFTVVERVRLGALAMDLYRLRVPVGTDVEAARNQLVARFPGLLVDANHQFEAQAKEDFRNQLPRALMGWKAAKPTCGQGIRLGMIDASVDVSHPALAGQRIEFRSFHKPERRPGPADHGTAVAGILVGKPDWGGLLPGAELKAANMFEMNEVGAEVGNAVALLKAVDWLVGETVAVINMSVAGGDNKAVRLAVSRTLKQGQIVIAAAGNWGAEAPPAYPAAYQEVMAVTAIGENRAPYSQANHGNYIAFAAPGVQVYTAVPRGGRVQSGTSFATPFISAQVAIEIAQGAKADPEALIQKLRPITTDLGPPGRDNTFGWGLVNREPTCG